MKCTALFLLVILTLSAIPAFAEESTIIKPGIKIEVARKLMKEAGYQITGYAIIPHEPETNDLVMWDTGKGALIVEYIRTTREIVSLSLFNTDGRPKLESWSLWITVLSFNVKTGEMTIQVPKPKQEQTKQEG